MAVRFRFVAFHSTDSSGGVSILPQSCSGGISVGTLKTATDTVPVLSGRRIDEAGGHGRGAPGVSRHAASQMNAWRTDWVDLLARNASRPSLWGISSLDYSSLTGSIGFPHRHPSDAHEAPSLRRNSCAETREAFLYEHTNHIEDIVKLLPYPTSRKAIEVIGKWNLCFAYVIYEPANRVRPEKEAMCLPNSEPDLAPTHGSRKSRITSNTAI